MHRVVIDTSIVISAALQPEGKSYFAFLTALEKFQPLVSFVTYAELVRVFEKPKFKGKITQETKSKILKKLLDKSEMINLSSQFNACRDPNDDMFLHLAIDGKADIILTRDPDLLELHPFQGIPILKPTDFLVWSESKII
jgi:putative PIN family toxin of toxin-antitoxin system